MTPANMSACTSIVNHSCSTSPALLKLLKKLEQLRILEQGHKILVAETQCADTSGHSVDTPGDQR
jgi:CMP-2-keto-3-deoxyoctulosonic acid synthetase